MPLRPSSSSSHRVSHQMALSSTIALPYAKQLQQLKDAHVSCSSAGRKRPAFEKILIGPCMILGELVTGGHYLEVLRLGKQMTVGREPCPSYVTLHRSFVSETGLLGAFYRGFFPWGLLQTLKGVPVLFVQNESSYQLRAKAGWSESSAEKASGFIGGASQAIFVCPAQKLKVTVVACPATNALSPFEATKHVVRKHGFASLYHGLFPTMVRRSLDWGIRFTVSSEAKKFMIEKKRAAGKSEELKMHELIACGLVGGAFSALTHPIDNIITNSQKPMPHGKSRDLVSVVRRMVRESGTKAFTRGFAIKVVDNAYHMAWMYGVGTVVYDYTRNWVSSSD